MKNETLFLRGVALLMALGTLAICGFVLPHGFTGEGLGIYAPIAIVLYVAAAAFLYGLYKVWRIMDFIDKNAAFSEATLQALGGIKLAALAVAAVFIAGTPFLYLAAEMEDAPGVLALGLTVIVVASAAAVAAGIMRALAQQVIDKKPAKGAEK